MGAASFSFSKVEAWKVFKVFLWTVASASVALLLSLLDVIEMPAQYAAVVPLVNTVLVAVQQFITDNR